MRAEQQREEPTATMLASHISHHLSVKEFDKKSLIFSRDTKILISNKSKVINIWTKTTKDMSRKLPRPAKQLRWTTTPSCPSSRNPSAPRQSQLLFDALYMCWRLTNQMITIMFVNGRTYGTIRSDFYSRSNIIE